MEKFTIPERSKPFGDIKEIREVVSKINASPEDSDSKDEKIKDILTEAFYSLETSILSNGGEVISEGLSDIFSDREFIVRNEAPEKVQQVINDGSVDVGLEQIGLRDNVKYANAIQWEPGKETDSIRPVFEGVGGLAGLVTILGVSPSRSLAVMPVEKDFDSEISLTKGKKTYNTNNIRHIEGQINREDVNFILVRIPGKYFPEEQMTLKEQERYQTYKKDLSDYQIYEQEVEKAKENRRLSELPTKKRPEPFFVFRTFLFNKKRADSPDLSEQSAA